MRVNVRLNNKKKQKFVVIIFFFFEILVVYLGMKLFVFEQSKFSVEFKKCLFVN